MFVDIEKYLLDVEKPAQYMGNEINSIHKEDFVSNMCLFFPSIYEVGMSNVGFRILYDILNKVEGFSVERGFSPMNDMQEILRKNNLPLFSIESKRELKSFDLLGFSFSYEVSYVEALNALNLAGIPFKSKERGEEYPIILGGGTCMMNPAPVKEFLDVIVIGDGEENMPAIAKKMMENKDKSKIEKLKSIMGIEGVYIPSLHKEEEKVKRAILTDLNKSSDYHEQIVPYINIVHDRAAIEIQRGCTRGCRFCQAGMVYRPVRERDLKNNLELIDKSLESTGYSEISLSSLSSSDYSRIEPLLESIQENHGFNNIGVSLPSLRMNPTSVEVTEKITSGKKTGFTFAPEAGSQRLRDIINKGVEEEEILETAVAAVKKGWTSLKFYFMIGLPFETKEDVEGIYHLVEKVASLCRPISRRIQITASVSNFVPKAHTPFQWAKQMDFTEMEEKHKLLKELFYKKKNLGIKIHDMRTSYIEGFLSRGDEKIGELLVKAYENGVHSDYMRGNFDKWAKAIEDLGIKESDYLGERDLDGNLPWDLVETGFSKEFLKAELDKARDVVLTSDCRGGCHNCGMRDRIADCGKLLSK